MIEELQKQIKELKVSVHKAYETDEKIRLKKELYRAKLNLLDIIHEKDKARAGLTARQLIEKVDSMPKMPKFETGMYKIDSAFRGGFETGLFINLAGESFAGKCVDGETEFLSPNGWKKIKDYSGEKVARYSKDGSVHFVSPKLFYVAKTKKFYHMKTKQIDMMVTESHRMPYLTSKGNLNKKTFKELYESKKIYKARMINSFSLNKEDGLDVTDDDIRLMMCLYADGTMARKQWRVRLKKDRKKQRLEMLLRRLNIEFRIKHYGNIEGFNDYIFYYDKCTKDMTELYGCNRKQLEVVCDEFIHWDGGYRSKTKAFYTTIKKHADFMQYALSSCGKVSFISTQDRIGKKHSNSNYIYKSIEYTVSESKWKNTTLSSRNTKREEKIKEIECDDYCYCFTMGDTEDNDMWIARRNDYVFATGNTTLLLNLLANLSNSRKTVFFNFEMGDKLFVKKLKELNLNNNQLDNMIIDSDTNNLQDLIMEIEIYAEEGVKFFAIDSKMKITIGTGGKEYEQISAMSKELSRLCARKDITIILINQMSEEDIKNKRLAFKGGGDQKYDTDIALFLVRDKEQRKLICTKNRMNDILFTIDINKEDYTSSSIETPIETVFESNDSNISASIDNDFMNSLI